MFTSGVNQLCCSTGWRSVRSFRFATAFIVSSLLSAYADLFWFGFFGFRQGHGQNAVLVGRANLCGVHRRWQGDAALEAAHETFHTMTFGLFILLLELALARQGENTLVQGDVDLLFLHPRDFPAHEHMVLVFVKVDRRNPAAAKWLRTILEPRKRRFKQPINLFTQRRELLRGVPIRSFPTC